MAQIVDNAVANKGNDGLADFLKANDLYDDLYKILSDNKLGLNELKELRPTEVDQFSDTFKLNITQKLKLRSLITLIDNTTIGEQEIDNDLKIFLNKNDLPSDLYGVLMKEKIQYKHLEIIQPKEIDNVCNSNNIKIGIRYNLKTAIDKHQITILKQKYGTPGDDAHAQNDDIDKQSNDIDNNNDDKNDNLDDVDLDESEEEEKDKSIAHEPSFMDAQDMKDIDNKQWDYRMKLVVIGDSGVGKSSLLQKFLFGKFTHHMLSTLGVDCYFKNIELSDNSIMKMSIWDTGGQEKYKSIGRAYYNNADAIIICYGVDDKISVSNCSQWRNEIIEYGKDDVVVMLVGCKSDVGDPNDMEKNGRREITRLEAQKLQHMDEWKDIGAWWCECSAKTGQNVRSIFLTAAEKVKEKRLTDDVSNQNNNSTVRLLGANNQDYWSIQDNPGQQQTKTCCYYY